MAHIAERMTSHYRTIIDGLDVYCCPDPNELMPYVKEVHPQMLFGVPRVFEKIYAGVNAALGADPEKKQQFDDGVAAAIEIERAQFAGTATQEQTETLAFLDAVAFAPVRALVGLDDLELAITGAAPLPAAILEWFNAIGVKLAEIYGLSETTGPMTFSPVRNKPGWVGEQIPGCEVALADDGEIICRGGNVFQGYLNEPEKTADVLVDGWFHSGDIGEIDDEGYVRIIDRKKELIITSGGKNISPANLEAALKMIPIIGQACAIGDQRKFCSALLVLDPEVTPVWAAKNGKEGMSLAQLADDDDVRAFIQIGVDAINEQFAQVEQIKRFVVIGEEWLPDTDVLTPTSKLKRRGIHARYVDEIESMYT
jgi:long-chain acyl-CoA synthetase